MNGDLAAFLSAAGQALSDARGAMSEVDDKERIALLQQVEQVSLTCYSLMLDMLADLEGSGFAVGHGYPDTTRLVAEALRIDGREARRRVEDARLVGPRRTFGGPPLEPRLPHAAAALAVGRLNGTQLRVIAQALDQLPDRVPAAERDAAEAALVEHADRFGPVTVNRLAHRVLDGLDPDGPPPDDRDRLTRPANQLIRKDLPVGGSLVGRFDDEGWASLTAVLDSLNEPRPATSAGTDYRVASQRDGDALVQACRRLLDGGGLPTGGGERPHLTVTVTLEQLRAGLHRVQLDTGGAVDAGVVRRWACDARILPVVLGTHSEVLDVGRAAHTPPAGLRRAVAARDGGCAFPGCGCPAPWCHAHHLKPWHHGGGTKLDNLVLLCGYHHRLVHHSPWQVHMNHGHPEFTPPDWHPDRTPQRNPLRA